MWLPSVNAIDGVYEHEYPLSIFVFTTELPVILLEESIEVDACGEVICHHCIDETFICDKCGCRDFVSNLHYDRENNINVCINCRMEDYE